MSGLCQNLSDSEWDGQYHLAFYPEAAAEGPVWESGAFGGVLDPHLWRRGGPPLRKIKYLMHLTCLPPDVIRSILGITLQAAQTWERKVCASPVGGEGGGGGPCGGCEGLALDGGGETRKSRFRKTNLACALESTKRKNGVRKEAPKPAFRTSRP